MKVVDNFQNVYHPIICERKVTLTKDVVAKQTEYIEFVFEEWSASVGDDGYYMISDVDKQGSCLCYFREKEEAEYILQQNLMPVMGVKNKNGCYLFIADGMKNSFYTRVGLKNGMYYIAGRFELNQDIPYEDISFYIIDLGPEADYSDMAIYYRNYQLKRGACIPLKERIKENEFLSYAADSVEIRIRMGWKPAPAMVLEQTVENEPEMKVTCTFDRVKDLIDALKRKGVDKAELCLVGWNISGHDGRYPQLFPVDERLGGEKKLRDLIRYAQDQGYQIVCHTNSTDCYQIAEDWNEDIVIKKKDGSLQVNHQPWSGGNMYHLCPQKALEFAKRDLPKVAELGYKGIHYIDVMSVVPLRRCYDPNHPVTEADTELLYEQIGNQCHQLFGGFASEGAFDFAAKYLDYALYITFKSNQYTFFEKEIPFWSIVYHGIILNNPSTETVNYTIKSKDRYLKLMEYGGRPTFYIYSKFMTNEGNRDWLGKEDFELESEEDLTCVAENIAMAYEDYRKYRHLQYEFIESHREIKEGVFGLTYSDGTSVIVDYKQKTMKIE